MSLPNILRSLVLAAIIAQPTVAAAQIPNESEAVAIGALSKRVEAFFDNLKAPIVDAEDAFKDLLAGGPLIEQPEEVKAFVDDYKKLEAPYGRYLVAKQVQAKRIGDDLVFLTYLYETERFPIVWRFAFYRPPIESLARPDWFVVRLSFDTKVEQLSWLP
jgi:hypothetical protein